MIAMAKAGSNAFRPPTLTDVNGDIFSQPCYSGAGQDGTVPQDLTPNLGSFGIASNVLDPHRRESQPEIRVAGDAKDDFVAREERSANPPGLNRAWLDLVAALSNLGTRPASAPHNSASCHQQGSGRFLDNPGP